MHGRSTAVVAARGPDYCQDHRARRGICVPTLQSLNLIHGQTAMNSPWLVVMRLTNWVKISRETKAQLKQRLEDLKQKLRDFERVAVDIMEMPMTLQYVVVFMEYVTKWVEVTLWKNKLVKPLPCRLLIDNVVCQHGVPNQLLSRAKRVIKTDVRFWG